MSKNFTLQEISSVVCDYFGITEQQLFETSRKENTVRQRQLFFYFCREFSIESFYKIGHYAKRNHATVIHSVNKILIEREIYPDIKNDIEGITAMLFGSVIVQDVNLLSLCENYSKSFI